MKTKHLYVSLLVLLAAGRAAHADPLTDFKTGATFKIAAASVAVAEGSRSSTGSSSLAKTAGRLDFEVKASDLGVALPLKLQLRGRSLGGGLIEYTIDQLYSPRVDLGGGHYVTRVTGRVYLRASSLPGRFRHEFGNVSLRIAAPSSLVAYGDWGTLGIAIKELDLLGGVKQPQLDRFYDPTTTIICSDLVPKKHDFAVLLADVAKASGAVVELKTPRRAGVRVPSGIVVPTGQRGRTVTARIEPNFVGTVRVTASAGGIARALDVVVRPRTSCVQ